LHYGKAMIDLLETIVARLRFAAAMTRLSRLLLWNAGLYLLMLLASRCGLLPDLLHPATALAPAFLALVLALLLTPRPSREAAARAADQPAGDDLLLTALQSSQSTSPFAGLLQEQVDARVPEVVPAEVAPILWQPPCKLAFVLTTLLALLAAFLPSWDPFCKQATRELAAEAQATLDAMAEATEARLEILDIEDRGDAHSTLAEFADELQQMEQSGSMDESQLAARRAELTRLWQEQTAQLQADGASAAAPEPSRQQLGGAAPGAKLEQLAQQLRTPQDIAAMKTELQSLAQAHATDPIVQGAIERIQERLAMLEAGLPPATQLPEIQREASELRKALDPQQRAPAEPAPTTPLSEQEVADIMERAFCAHCRLLGTDNSCPACHGTGVPLEKLEKLRKQHGGGPDSGTFGSEQDGSEQREHTNSAASDSERAGVSAESTRDSLSQSAQGRGQEQVRQRLERAMDDVEAAMNLPVQARKQAVMQIRTDLDGIADETLTLGLQSRPISEAQERAAGQLRMAGIDSLSEDALRDLLDTLELTQAEIDRLAAMRAELRAMDSALRSSQALEMMAGAAGQDDGKGKGGGIAKQGAEHTGTLRAEHSQSRISAGASKQGAASAGRRGQVQSIGGGAPAEVAQAVSTAIERERVPAGYHETVKRYFAAEAER
jgi:hypothetical protein